MQPHGVVVVFPQVGDLDETYFLPVVHHSRTSRPAEGVHTHFRNMSWTGDTEWFVCPVESSIGKIIAVLLHEGNLFLYFLRHPCIVSV